VTEDVRPQATLEECLARSRRRQLGQTLVLFVILLPGLLAVCALGLDAANLYVERRQMQAAADLAALAGARLLPNAVTATAKAQSVATANGYATTVTVTTPYGGDTGKIEVRITHATNTLFLPILGVSSLNVSARGVGKQQILPPTGTPFVLMAGSTTCGGSNDTIAWQAGGGTITGLIQSNGGIKQTGSSNIWTGGTTYACTGGYSNTGGSNVVSPAAALGSAISYPISYAWNDYCATPTYYSATGTFDLGANGPWWVGGTKTSKKLNPGVYCADGATGAITLNVQGTNATNVTLVARTSVKITDSSFFISPNKLGTAIAAFGTGASTIGVAAASGASGILWAPNGEANFSASGGGTYTGTIIANTVKVSGSGMTIIGTIPSGSSTTQLQLVE
jgi:Flp pilus assembly protein TadG